MGLGNIEAVLGCTNPNYAEYDVDNPATTDDGSCETFLWTATSLDVTLPGYVDWEFTDSSTGGTPTEWLWDFGDQATSTEQNPTHRYTESGQYTVTMTASNEWGSSEITQDVEIEIDIPGCTDPAYQEYNSTVTVDDGSCLTPGVPGCMDPAYTEYNPDATADDGSCVNLVVEEIFGCMDPAYQEYNPDATADDGSCRTLIQQDIFGCMDPAYLEYNSAATVDDGTCKTLKQR
jgi:hypothetical protein